MILLISQGDCMSLFREIWKKSIYYNQQMVLKEDQKGNTVFKDLINEFPDDGMVYFERGIAFETMGKYGLAKLDYEKAKELFPVPHWKKNADFYIERTTLKKSNFNYVINKTDFNKYKLDILFTLHTYVFIPNKLRYLAISSVSRIDSEPEMAIIVFRTCIESALKEFENTPNNNTSNHLETLITNLIPRELFQDFDNIRRQGNNAVHSNSETYSDSDLIDILTNFINCMSFINDKFKQNTNNPFLK